VVIASAAHIAVLDRYFILGRHGRYFITPVIQQVHDHLPVGFFEQQRLTAGIFQPPIAVLSRQ